MIVKRFIGATAFAAVLLSALSATAEPGAKKGAVRLVDVVGDALAGHERIKAAEADLAAAKEDIEVEWGNWYPDLDISAYYGHEIIRNGKETDDTKQMARNVDTTVTQQLWDFGATNADIRSATLSYDRSKAQLQATRQALMLDAATAYLQLTKASKVLDFAKSSEQNIRRQTELENALVKRGSGFATNVLQAKRALSQAQARRVQAEGQLQTAINLYRRVFKSAPADLSALRRPSTPSSLMPETVEDAVKIALDTNPSLRAAALGVRIAAESIKSTKASEFFPEIDGIYEYKYRRDDNGTLGDKTEQIIKVEFSYDFNLGFTAINSLKASEFAHTATAQRLINTRDRTEEQVRNAWDDVQTARLRAEYLRNAANIAAEFLDLARKERQLGQRDLIDVLSEETALINASSDAAAAEMDAAVAVYRLLSAMGTLDVGMLE